MPKYVLNLQESIKKPIAITEFSQKFTRFEAIPVNDPGRDKAAVFLPDFKFYLPFDISKLKIIKHEKIACFNGFCCICYVL